MADHKESMNALLDSALMLDYEDAEKAAQKIALAPPFPVKDYRVDPSEPRLPGEFSALQAELRNRARELAQAAAAHNPKRLTRAFGKVAESCISCHTLFAEPELKGR
jgi:hypothetical protein